MNYSWPELFYEDAKGTYETVHMWTQIAGKIKLALLPWINHSWHVTLYVSPTGFTTLSIPYENQYFQIDFDFIEHKLKIITSQGTNEDFGLKELSVADFYNRIIDSLARLNISVTINPVPAEIENAIPFHKDHIHATYIPEYVTALHRALLNIQEVLTRFRSQFKGKCSPVHFFWGGFDIAVTRFSGRKAPLHPGGVPNLPDWVAQEAYSHEVSSCGFWPGSHMLPEAAFYSYAYPEPDGYKEAIAKPQNAYYHPELREFILAYDVVQRSEQPENLLLDFLDSTYNSCVKLARWDREALER